MKSRMVCDPLTVRGCCLVTDGGAALIMTSAERAKDLKQKPVYLLGGAAATHNRAVSAMPDIVNTCARESGRRAFEMAGITTEDARSEEHTSELQSLMRISYAVFCLQNNKTQTRYTTYPTTRKTTKTDTTER